MTDEPRWLRTRATSDVAVGYHVDVTCGDCGGELSHSQNGTHKPTEAVAAAECPDCGSRWVVRVQLARLGHPPPASKLAAVMASRSTGG